MGRRLRMRPAGVVSPGEKESDHERRAVVHGHFGVHLEARIAHEPLDDSRVALLACDGDPDVVQAVLAGLEPVVGVIPESENVLAASNAGVPVILDDNSHAGQAYSDTVARILGEERAMRFLDAPKKGFFQRVFGG